jgi:hypothetical protein
MTRCTLPSQIDFSFLSVPDFQPGACAQDAMDHDAFSRSGSSISEIAAMMDQDAYVPVNYIGPEAYALLAAAEASAARHAAAAESGVMELDVNSQGSTLQSALDEMYDPERVLTIMAPPKRFYRTFWLSVSLRLLERWARTASPCGEPAPNRPVI